MKVILNFYSIYKLWIYFVKKSETQYIALIKKSYVLKILHLALNIRCTSKECGSLCRAVELRVRVEPPLSVSGSVINSVMPNWREVLARDICRVWNFVRCLFAQYNPSPSEKRRLYRASSDCWLLSFGATVDSVADDRDVKRSYGRARAVT